MAVQEGRATSALISADRVEGTDVFNGQGEHIGHVEDVMLDKLSGRVAYAIIGFGGFLGIGEKYHPLPWSVLTYDVARGGYVVPIDKDALKDAPSFSLQELNPDDREWGTRVHDYYGVSPYWM